LFFENKLTRSLPRRQVVAARRVESFGVNRQYRFNNPQGTNTVPCQHLFLFWENESVTRKLLAGIKDLVHWMLKSQLFQTTMICTHVLDKGPTAVKSPGDYL